MVWNLVSGKMLSRLTTEGAQVEQLAFTPDGARLLTASESRYSASSIQLWEMPAARRARTFAGKLRQTPSPFWMVPFAVTPDGKWLAICANDHIDLWDTGTGYIRWHLPLPDERCPLAMAINPAGTLLLALVANVKYGKDSFMVWDLTTGMVKKTMPISFHSFFESSTFHVTFSPDGSSAAGCCNNEVVLWNTRNWVLERRITEQSGMMDDVAFSPDSKKLAWLCSHYTRYDAPPDSQLVIWDIAGDRRETITGEKGQSFADLTFSPDGKWLATRAGGEVLLWNLAEGKRAVRSS